MYKQYVKCNRASKHSSDARVVEDPFALDVNDDCIMWLLRNILDVMIMWTTIMCVKEKVFVRTMYVQYCFRPVIQTLHCALSTSVRRSTLGHWYGYLEPDFGPKTCKYFQNIAESDTLGHVSMLDTSIRVQVTNFPLSKNRFRLPGAQAHDR